MKRDDRLVIEDPHWNEPASQDVIDRFFAVARARIAASGPIKPVIIMARIRP